MVCRTLTKADGRQLILYARDHVRVDETMTSPHCGEVNAHLRWHPLRAEWVAYATHRQDRTFLPSADHNPLAPSSDPSRPTELPAGDYDVAVFENLFPTFTPRAHDPPVLSVPTREGRGSCEVVVFTQDPKGSLGALPLWHVDLVLEVWASRYAELGSRPDVQYVFPFENRGVEVGVTLSHPHGQIYAYPFIPPIPARELEQQLAYLATHGTSLVGDLVDRERKEARRILYEGAHCAAFVPVVARYPYEVWLAPYSPYASFADLPSEVRRDLARALKLVLMKYDGLWQRPFPYILVVHQAPTDGRPHPEAHVHIEIYPALRMRDRIKYLAGSEIGAGVFTADTNPDDKAAELQAVSIRLD